MIAERYLIKKVHRAFWYNLKNADLARSVQFTQQNMTDTNE